MKPKMFGLKLTRRFLSTQKKKSAWKSVIGLEIHAQINTETKLFSGARTDFASQINNNVSLFDAAIPGTLPVLNKKCVEYGIKTALALSCQINEISMFERKHYFYADLPSGYQITQQRAPLAKFGTIKFPVIVPGNTKKPYYKTVRLTQLQLEQDSGKSLHDDVEGKSLVDLNRAGVPLMELVFEPDLEDGEEAAALVKELVLILNRLGTCSCKMEEGALRVDANISIHKPNEPYGTRTEIKNIGSIRGVAAAIEYEIKRQIDIKNKGGRIINETRSYDATTKSTIAMRDKEVVQDYRFMPEPNLPPLYLNLSDKPSDVFVNVVEIKKEMPELPEDTRNRLMSENNVSQEVAIILMNEEVLLKYFREMLSENPSRSAKLISNILINEFLKFCNKNKINPSTCDISSDRLGCLVDMLESKELTLNLARLVLEEMFSNTKSPRDIAEENNWKPITDIGEIIEICEKTLNENPKMVDQFRAGKTKVLFAIAGDIAKKTANRIDMAKVIEILKEKLEK